MTKVVTKQLEKLDLYDGNYLLWEQDGKEYCIRIQIDDTGWFNPRKDVEHNSIMACWHPRYNLGDNIEGTPLQFWQTLVRENVPCSELKNIEIEDMSLKECMTIMQNYAVWLPLWLYDHSGITMSCGNRTYPYNDYWDSMQVGWIISLKKDTISLEAMKEEVREYDDYLTGNVYGYTLYMREEGEWQEVDSCWGFLGTDILKNGMLDIISHMIGSSCYQQICLGNFKKGDSKKIWTVTYKFE